MRTDDETIWQAVYDARLAFWERRFGPFPDQVQKLMNLMAVWPGGCLAQFQAHHLGGTWLTTSFGLTNPDMPTRTTTADYSITKGADGPVYDSRIELREPRSTPDGQPGYGYEIILLTEDRCAWPLMFLNWVVPMEILKDMELLDRVEEIGAVTAERVPLGEAGYSDFIIGPASAALPGTFQLPNGIAKVLVAAPIHPSETAYALNAGQAALYEHLVKHGGFPLSRLSRRSSV